MFFSHNTAKLNSALKCEPIYSTNNLGTNIIYSSFADNNATSQSCISININDQAIEFLIRNTNIIRNSGDRTIYTNGNTNMNECCIMKNIGDDIFYTESGGFTLTDCSVDENIDSYNTNNKPNIDNIATKSFIHVLIFHETGNCINTFDTIEGVPLTGLMPQTRPVYFSNEKHINRYEINH